MSPNDPVTPAGAIVPRFYIGKKGRVLSPGRATDDGIVCWLDGVTPDELADILDDLDQMADRSPGRHRLVVGLRAPHQIIEAAKARRRARGVDPNLGRAS